MVQPYDEAHLDRFMNKIGELPTVPLIIRELDQLVEDPKTTAADLNKVLSTDPGLGTKVLRLANSPFYGIPRKVTNLTHAISLLGFNVIRNIALSAFMFQMFDHQRMTFDPEKYWMHCVANGTACRAIGDRLQQAAGEDLFIMGLLHDIGKLVIAQYSDRDYSQIVPKAQASHQKISEVELEALGFNHCHVGAWLARHWQFPAVITDVLENHHTPEDAQAREVVLMVNYGDTLVRSLHLGMWEDQQLPYDGPTGWAELGGKIDDVGPVMDTILKNMSASKMILETFSFN